LTPSNSYFRLFS